jgi:hypothetical protein
MPDIDNINEDLSFKINYVQQQETLLFQRFNYFLVGIAFLVIAFTSCVVSNGFGYRNLYLVFFAVLISATGYNLSFFFMITNYVNSKMINSYIDIIDGIGQFPNRNMCFIQFTRQPWQDTTIRMTLIRDIFRLIGDPIRNRLNSPHVFLVPMGFTAFWFFALAGVFHFTVSYIIEDVNRWILCILIVVLALIPIIYAAWCRKMLI